MKDKVMEIKLLEIVLEQQCAEIANVPYYFSHLSFIVIIILLISKGEIPL